MKTTFLSIILILCILNLTGCLSTSDDQQELYFLTASSLTDVMNELIALYEEEHPEIQINLSFASSGQLKQQILQGAPADLFFSAAENEMQELIEERMIEESIDVVQNELVLITHKDSDLHIDHFTDLADAEVILLSIGQPESVPAGRYALQALEGDGIWGQVQSKIVYAKDVRQVLSYVVTKNVEAGFVYKTDALLSDQVRISAKADPKSHDPIVYPVGILKQSQNKDQTRQVIEFLLSEQARHIFEKYGFTLAHESKKGETK